MQSNKQPGQIISPQDNSSSSEPAHQTSSPNKQSLKSAKAFQPSAPIGPTDHPAPSPLSSKDAAAMLKKHSPLPMILAILFGVLWAATTGFAGWAFSQRLDYKNNSDQKSATAVEKALDQQKEKLSAEFAEQEKEPFLTYVGPETYGSVRFEYPKTWSVYSVNKGSKGLTIFMNPKVVDEVGNKENIQALVFSILPRDYNSSINKISKSIQRGKLKSKSFRPAKVPSVLGLRVSGQLDKNVQGTRVYIPVRDRTLVFTTESNQKYLKDFERVLSTLTFIP